MIDPIKIIQRLQRYLATPLISMRRKLRRMLFGDPRVNYIARLNNEVFVQAGVEPVAFKIMRSPELQPATDVILRKERGGIVALIRTDCEWRYVCETRDKIAPYAFWFNRTSSDVRQITVNAADGNLPSMADYRFSSTSDQHILLPDAHFFKQRGYAETDAFATSNAVSWEDRSDEIVWRGSDNGTGHWSVDPETVVLPGVMQRLHMAHKCKALGVDFRFVAKPDAHDYLALKNAGFVGDFIPTHDWASKKYAIDIDGFTNAWCNFMQRMKLGCCVLKVDSPFGYRQWYYDQIEPWEHFVPIKADLSNLQEQIDWVYTNTNKAREIASNAQAFAKNLTFESERDYAVEAIEKREMRG